MTNHTSHRPAAHLGKALALWLVMIAVIAPALAGSMDLEWEGVHGQSVAGYRIYSGTRPEILGTAQDTMNVTASTLSNLSPCTYYYVAVKARDSNGVVSDDFSNIVQGYPHPEVSSLTPSVLQRGSRATVVVAGTGFVAGAVPSFDSNKITLTSHRIDACGQMTLELLVDAHAPMGLLDLTITNPDGGFIGSPGALRIAGSAGTGDPLVLVSVQPGPDATGVDPATAVRVQFATPIDSSTATSGRFRIRKVGSPGGASLLGRPVLDASGTMVTLNLARPLEAGQMYTVLIKGGKGGVRDTQGNTLPADFELSPAFTTAGLFAESDFGPIEQIAEEGAPLLSGATVPAASAFLVKFTEPMNATTLNSRTIRIRSVTGKRVPLAPGYPALLPDGLSVLLVPAEPLAVGGSFDLSVKGRKKGVSSARGVTMALEQVIPFTTSLGTVGALGVAH